LRLRRNARIFRHASASRGSPWLVIVNKQLSPRAGLLMVMCASLLWGTGNIVAKSVYDVAQTNSISIAFFRMLLSLPPLLVVCGITLGRNTFSIKRSDLPQMLVVGALVALYQATFYASLPRIGVAIATVIALASAPALVALLSIVFLRERPTRSIVAALLLAVLGVVLITDLSASAAGSDLVGGVGFALLSGALYAINVLVGRRLGRSSSAQPLQTTLVGFTFGALLLFVIAQGSTLVTTYPPGGWLRLAYLGVVTTAIGYGLFYAGMRYTSAAVASIATLVEPLTATLLAVLLFSEPLSARALAGGVLMVLAMALLAVSENRSGQ
jgi:drug/metabolite transporter, DME family